MTEQSAIGDYIAQASEGSTATVNVYQGIRPSRPDEAELARARELLSQLPLDHVPERSSVLPAGSRLPHRLNPHFVGRRRDLRQLARLLKGQTATVVNQVAATGLGGIGKTQLAVEFAHRYGRYFAGGVHWVTLEDPASIPAEIAACGGAMSDHLRLDFHTLPLDLQVAVVLKHWRGPLPRLLIFDNCESEELLTQWRPPSGATSLLLTTRRSDWKSTLGVRTVSLGVFSGSESVELLKRHCPQATTSALYLLADEVGDLPLALHLIGSYLETYSGSPVGDPAAVLQRLRRPDLLSGPILSGEAAEYNPTEHDQHVARTFAVSLSALDPDGDVDNLALRLLAASACFLPGEPIPRSLLMATVQGGEREPATTAVPDALNRLLNLGLLQPETDDTLLLHRLVAHFVHRSQEEFISAAQPTVESAVALEASSLNRAGYPAPLLAWQAHLQYIAEQAHSRGSELAGSLWDLLGYHLRMLAAYPASQAAHERALAIDEATYGPVHPEVAVRVNNLGLVLREEGDLAEAQAAFERALAIYEGVHGPHHPKVALTVNNLGSVLQARGDLAGAQAAYERALEIYEVGSERTPDVSGTPYGPHHSQVASTINNLGSLLQEQGELARAQQAYERALAISEAASEPNHPSVATRLNNLGLVLRDLGDLAAARAALDRALAIDEAAYGPDHPDVARDVNNLGLVLEEQADLAGAQAAFERALAIDEEVYGPDHPKVATDVGNLGAVLRGQGNLAGARKTFERALAINEAAYGPDHPQVAHDVGNLGLILRDLGDLAGARETFERALAISEAVYGPKHPEVARAVNNLGAVLKDLGDLAGARAAFERALAIDEEVYGQDHPNVATDAGNLGTVLRDLGDLAGARDACERALAIDQAAYGPGHPAVARDVNYLGSVLRAEGDLEGAREAYERALAIDQAAYGPHHPEVATDVNNLGGVLKDLGDLAGARDAYERALAIFEDVPGQDHINVAILHNNLGSVLQAQGDLAGAREAYERALALLEHFFGRDHPKTQLVRRNLDALEDD